VLHLIERLSFLNRVVEKDRVAVLESLLRADIASGAALLLNDSNGAVA
jgi:hypothetical protein